MKELNAEITWYKLAYSLLLQICGIFMLKLFLGKAAWLALLPSGGV